jgi:uncharacterized pyridoxal phosphate-containing UPF0001 family protein
MHQPILRLGERNLVLIFQRLVECRTRVAEALNLQEKDLELSMGMSGDYKVAVCGCRNSN